MWRTILRLLEVLFVPVLVIIVSVSGPAHPTFRVKLIKIIIIVPIVVMFALLMEYFREKRIEKTKYYIAKLQGVKPHSIKDPVIVPVKVERVLKEK